MLNNSEIDYFKKLFVFTEGHAKMVYRIYIEVHA